MASLWNPNDLADMVLPPCHYGFQIYINDGKLNLMWQQRSVDVFLGLPYDIAMYGLLLQLLAEGFEYAKGELIGCFGDCHLYSNHIDQAKQQLDNDFRELPRVDSSCGITLVNEEVILPELDMIKLKNYNPHPPIKAKLNT